MTSRAAKHPAGARSGRGSRAFLVGLARAFAGALIFALPMFMTMEMWRIGTHTNPWKLALLLLLMVPLLVGLSRYAGFKHTELWRDGLADALVAIVVAFVVAVLVCAVFAIVTPDMGAREIIGKIALQLVPGSIGAMLARAQLAGEADDPDEERDKREREEPEGYWSELFIMGVGALFLSLNVAPTEEVLILSYQMGPWHTLALVLLSLAVMHAFVYVVEFRGTPSTHPDAAFWSLFLHFTVTGYALVLAICLYLLWTFDRTEGASLEAVIGTLVVLGFPGAVGAAAARLIF